MEDDLMNRMTEYLGGVMIIQYTLAACLDEAGILPKAKLAEELRYSAQNYIQEPRAVNAVIQFVDVLEGTIESPGIGKPDWFRGVIDGGKKPNDD